METDAEVGALLAEVRRVAVLGVSDRFTRPSFRIAAYLLDRTAWTVDLVNPHVVETLGRLCAPTLADVPVPDLVVVFRAPEVWDAVVDEVAAVGAGAVWLPGGVADAATTARTLARARAAGVEAVADRDVRAEHKRWCT
ncbi:CoA-binding protein [Actinomycetospora straminea]|uniref:CoA-binding domain-containing protein n=1 Tax=Actinomycetospora straminea TaxID=663607 RepID=A0ABP9DY25_9PSEU|nr:CoA-binding protein [Actinomycetospora straminea]MDD7934289.1 CoA-binding protein [Actinomycetospora straminea]